MKYLLISDIHGSLPALQKALQFYHEQQCDMLIILGDILNYGPRNGLPQGLDPQGIARTLNDMADEIVAIRGNCDSEVDQMLLQFPIMADSMLLVDHGTRLLLTHGHIYNETTLPRGPYDAIVYGHTHLYKLQRQDSLTVCNTGSVTFPKGGNPPTMALLDNGTLHIINQAPGHEGESLATLDIGKAGK